MMSAYSSVIILVISITGFTATAGRTATSAAAAARVGRVRHRDGRGLSTMASSVAENDRVGGKSEHGWR